VISIDIYINVYESASKLGYDSKWRSSRNRYLKENSICSHCNEKGELTRATVVGHIKPIEVTKLFSGMKATGRLFVKIVMTKRQ